MCTLYLPPLTLAAATGAAAAGTATAAVFAGAGAAALTAAALLPVKDLLSQLDVCGGTGGGTAGPVEAVCMAAGACAGELGPPKMFEKKQFGPTKDKTIPNPTLTVSGTPIEVCFASENRCADRIVATLKGSTKTIRFLAFSFTSTPIYQAMLDRRANGVTVSGVFETTGSDTQFSAYGKLKKEGVEVYTDGNPYVMHHKVIIIDDHIVIFGSFNFSDNANTQNDENLLIVDNA